jgi:hypothetical protein
VVVLSGQTGFSKRLVVFGVVSSHTHKAKATHQHPEHSLPSPLYLSQYNSPPQKPLPLYFIPSLASIALVLRTTFGLCVGSSAALPVGRPSAPITHPKLVIASHPPATHLPPYRPSPPTIPSSVEIHRQLVRCAVPDRC